MARISLWLLIAATFARGGDAQHGKMLVRDELHCLECHSARGQGGRTAPDLAQTLVADYSPAALASQIWNHTPAMWEEMSHQTVPHLLANDEEWEDVFAYLFWLAFSEQAGNIERGEHVFRTKQCASCHSVELPSSGTGTGVPTWNIASDPVALFEEMWKHATAMRGEARERATGWKRLSGQDLVDLTAYVQSVQKVRPDEILAKLSLPNPSEGIRPFQENCSRCHRGKKSLPVLLANKTWMDIGAGMWNHIPAAGPIRDIPTGDMRKLLVYAWEQQYAGPEGNPTRGRKTFEKKGCVACHSDARGKASSPRPGRKYTAYSMVALGWTSGRVVHVSMQRNRVAWPYLSAQDIADLVAFFNARNQTTRPARLGPPRASQMIGDSHK